MLLIFGLIFLPMSINDYATKELVTKQLDTKELVEASHKRASTKKGLVLGLTLALG